MAVYTYPNKQEQPVAAHVANAEQLGIAPAELQHTLKLAGLLQTSLEIETILGFFIDALQEKTEFDGVNSVAATALPSRKWNSWKACSPS